MTEAGEKQAYELMLKMPACISKIRTETAIQDIAERDKVINSLTYHELLVYYENTKNYPNWSYDDIVCKLWQEGLRKEALYTMLIILRLSKVLSRRNISSIEEKMEILENLKLTPESFEIDYTYLLAVWHKIRKIVQLVNPSVKANIIRDHWETDIPESDSGPYTYYIYDRGRRFALPNRSKVKKKFTPSFHYINLLQRDQTGYSYTVGERTFIFAAEGRDYRENISVDKLIMGKAFVWPGSNDYVLFPRALVEQVELPLFKWMRAALRQNYRVKYWPLPLATALDYFRLNGMAETVLFEEDYIIAAKVNENYDELAEDYQNIL